MIDNQTGFTFSSSRRLTLCYLPIVMSTMLLVTQAQAAQTCRDGSTDPNVNDIVPTTPTSQFEMHRDANGQYDGTVTDKNTGLMWMRCSLGQTWDGTNCNDTALTYTWQEALAAAEGYNSGGGYAAYSDWRLPNIKELASIVEVACFDPAINQTVFVGTESSYYWSASPSAYGSNNAWSVYFNNGGDGAYGKSDGSPHVRLVRAGQ